MLLVLLLPPVPWSSIGLLAVGLGFDFGLDDADLVVLGFAAYVFSVHAYDAFYVSLCTCFKT